MLSGKNFMNFDEIFHLVFSFEYAIMLLIFSDPPCKRCKSDGFELQWVRYC